MWQRLTATTLGRLEGGGGKEGGLKEAWVGEGGGGGGEGEKEEEEGEWIERREGEGGGGRGMWGVG